MTEPNDTASEEFDLGRLDAAELGEHVTPERLYRDYLRGMYVMFKCAFLYETNNATLRQACERVSRMANLIRDRLESVVRLELLADGVYLDRTLVRLDFSRHDGADYVHALCSALNVHAIIVTGATSIDNWLELVRELQRCTGPGGDLGAFTERKYDNIQLDPTPNVRGGTSASDRYRAIEAYAALVIMLGELADDARLGKALRPARIKRPIQELVSLSRDCAPVLLALAHVKRRELADLHHLANTAVFVICCVGPLGLSRATVCELALRAALHDIGRVVAPATAGSVEGILADRRIAECTVRTLATGALDNRLMARAVIANEVRRWSDRESEPLGDDLYPFELATSTRLVAVARSYSLLIAPRPSHPAGILPDVALRVLAREAGRRYDAGAVELVVGALGAYPVGSTVQLSDDRLAIVVEAPREETVALRPRVKIVREGGANVDGAIVDLGGIDGQHLDIVRCIDAEAEAINAPALLAS